VEPNDRGTISRAAQKSATLFFFHIRLVINLD
jgi:hypothetical protein